MRDGALEINYYTVLLPLLISFIIYYFFYYFITFLHFMVEVISPFASFLSSRGRCLSSLLDYHDQRDITLILHVLFTIHALLYIIINL